MSSLSHSLSLWKGLKPTNLLPLGCCRATNWPRHTCHWSYDHHTEIQHPEKFPQIYLECEWASVCVCYCRKVTKSNAKWSDQCIVRLIMEKELLSEALCSLFLCLFARVYTFCCMKCLPALPWWHKKILSSKLEQIQLRQGHTHNLTQCIQSHSKWWHGNTMVTLTEALLLASHPPLNSVHCPSETSLLKFTRLTLKSHRESRGWCR